MFLLCSSLSWTAQQAFRKVQCHGTTSTEAWLRIFPTLTGAVVWIPSVNDVMCSTCSTKMLYHLWHRRWSAVVTFAHPSFALKTFQLEQTRTTNISQYLFAVSWLTNQYTFSQSILAYHPVRGLQYHLASQIPGHCWQQGAVLFSLLLVVVFFSDEKLGVWICLLKFPYTNIPLVMHHSVGDIYLTVIIQSKGSDSARRVGAPK